MKQKTLLYGVIGGLAVLLYFKFGKKKLEETTQNSGGNGSSTTGGAKPLPTKPTVKNCGNFTVYYGSVKNDFKWNNGKPTVTKTNLPPYPMAMGGGMLEASGSKYANLSIISDMFTPQTKAVTVAEYNKACADKKTGNFDTAKLGGGAPPIDPNPVNPILLDSPIETVTITKPQPKPYYPYEQPYELTGFASATGDLDGDILERVIN